MNTELSVQATNATTKVAETITPAHMLQIAVEKGADLDRLQQLMDLQDRWS